uniref:HNH nuclease domain-containing protein n=1 Tax=viral metagenome TaxID=1070528 RepID=A0A6C0EDG0_9ZZZZ
MNKKEKSNLQKLKEELIKILNINGKNIDGRQLPGLYKLGYTGRSEEKIKNKIDELNEKFKKEDAQNNYQLKTDNYLSLEPKAKLSLEEFNKITEPIINPIIEPKIKKKTKKKIVLKTKKASFKIVDKIKKVNIKVPKMNKIPKFNIDKELDEFNKIYAKKKEEQNEENIKFSDVYVSVNLTIFYKLKDRRNNNTYPKKYDLKIKINIPSKYSNDKKYIEDYLNSSYDLKANIREPFENYTEDNEIQIHKISFINGDELEQDKDEYNLENLDLMMENATYPNMYPNDTVPYEHEEHQCVYGALKHRYGWNKEDLFKIFRDFYYGNNSNTKKNNLDIDIEEDEDEKEKDIKEDFNINSGVSTRMLLHLAKLKDFSLYAFDLNYNLFEKNISRNYNYPVLVYIMANHHLYLITDKKIIARLSNRYKKITNHFTNLFRGDKIDKKDTFNLPIVEDMGTLEIKNYKSVNIMYSDHDLTELHFRIFLDNNDLLMNVRTSGKKIIYMYYEKYDLHLHADVNYQPLLNLDYKKVMKICDNLKIPFKNQSITSIMTDYENMFFGIKRINISKSKKDEILFFQNNKCNICKNELSTKHFDHIKPLSNGGSNEIENIQALCVSCHLDKTKNERETGAYVSLNNSESTYNKITNEIFTSNLTKFWAFIESKDVNISKNYKTKVSIDINKCRRHILLYGKHDYPVYTVLDKPEYYNQIDDIKTGFYFVESRNYMPLRGNGWYSHNMIKYCLENNIINKNNILFKLIPSITLKHNYFKNFINDVVEKLDCIHKQGPNFFIGAFNKINTEITKMTFTTDKKEALNQFFDGNKNNFIEFYEDMLYKIYKSNNIEFNENRIPLYLQILEEETIELHKMESLIIKNGGIVSYYNTDNCVAYFQDNNNLVNEIVNNNYWDDDKKILKYKFEDIEYKQEFNRKSKYIRDDIYKLIEQPINLTTDENIDKDFTELIDLVVSSKKSYSILGRAGCGKSHLVKLIMDRLKAENNIYDFDTIISLAPTNKAALVIDGQTIHKFVASYFDNKKTLTTKIKTLQYIVIDEISMMTEVFYNIFLTIKKMFGVNFILVGDFEQLEPVCDRVGLVDYENSPAFLELCDYNKIVLDKCRRADDELYNLCKNVDSVNIDDFNKNMTMRNLCYTNSKRIAINEICINKYIENKLKKKEITEDDILYIEKLIYDDNSQDLKLTIGMPVISRVNKISIDLVNNQTFKIISIKNDIITLQDEYDDSILIDVNKKDFSKLFYIGFCITIHKSQGQTYNRPYTIHQWGILNKKLKYVALSRGTNKNIINIFK